MTKSEIEKDILINFVEWSIIWWIVVIFTPAIIWLMTGFATIDRPL